MITIHKNTSNDVVVTLTEKTTSTTGLYLFEFTHQMTGEIKIFTGTDISTAIGRYNEFNIIDSSTEIPYSAQMDFQIGFHTYKIYNILSAPLTIDGIYNVGIGETLYVYGDLTVTSTGVINNEGTIWVSGILTNNGIINDLNGDLILLPILVPGGELVEIGKVNVLGTANAPTYFEPTWKKDIPVWEG